VVDWAGRAIAALIEATVKFSTAVELVGVMLLVMLRPCESQIDIDATPYRRLIRYTHATLTSWPPAITSERVSKITRFQTPRGCVLNVNHRRQWMICQ